MDLFSLFEMDWYEKSSIVPILKKNRGKWIHFSDGAPNRDISSAKTKPVPERPLYSDFATQQKWRRSVASITRQNATYKVPKLGINPKSHHNDPKGIYFYPIDWLLSGHERIISGNQYAVEFPHYYIADIDLNNSNGIDLSKVTWDDIKTISKRNGWYDEFQKAAKYHGQKHIVV